jgi:tetratricopeptide (TPR) repeat protein
VSNSWRMMEYENNMAQTKATTAPVTKRNPRTLAGEIAPPVDDARTHALTLYEAALRLMQEGKYDAAQVKFNQLLTTGPGDLADRIRMYINACLMQVSKGKTDFQSHEERYDYAISLLNTGQYEDAREELKTILADNQNADYAFYGLAVLSSMTGDSHTCLEHLSEAIRLNSRNRIQARSDSDFQDMADDPRFTDLLYPEV